VPSSLVQRLAELKTLQSAATVAAEKQCASFALSKPIADCTINSVCTQKNEKFLALETNYKALAENEWSAILTYESKLANYTV